METTTRVPSHALQMPYVGVFSTLRQILFLSHLVENKINQHHEKALPYQPLDKPSMQESLLWRPPGTLVEQVMMIQIAVPSRVEVEEYRELKDEVDRLAGDINSEFGKPGQQALHYQFRGVPPHVLRALYRVAAVCLVTPLRDGLNLVAKEFVASRRDDDGVLVISENAGAAWELGEALRVNVYDGDDMVRVLRQAEPSHPTPR